MPSRRHAMSQASSGVRASSSFTGEIVELSGGLACRVGVSRSASAVDAGRASLQDERSKSARGPEHVRLGEGGLAAVVRLVQPVGPATHVTLDWQGGNPDRQPFLVSCVSIPARP